MSSADDVVEMKTLCGELAERLAPYGGVKARVNALMGKLRLGENRVVEFLRGKARRVESWEKDRARARLARRKDAERQRRELEHLTWLESEIARHRASGEELRGPHVDGLEHFLRLARGEDSTVEVSEAEAAE